MFILSVKATRKKTIVVAICLISLLAVGALVLFPHGSAAQTLTRQGVQIVYTAKNNEERLAFLKQYGWVTSTEPTEVKEVVIPADFDETFEQYNRIQLKQNLDLTKYRTKRCKRYTYEVKNYPGITVGVRANLLVYEDEVIAGDICTVELDGFMHGFEVDG